MVRASRFLVGLVQAALELFSVGQRLSAAPAGLCSLAFQAPVGDEQQAGSDSLGLCLLQAFSLLKAGGLLAENSWK